MWVRMSRFFDMAYLDKPLVRYRLHGRSATKNLEQIKKGTRYAAAKAIEEPGFREYPAHFRSMLLYYRSAAAWRGESRLSTLKFALMAFVTDPRKLRYGLRVLITGMRNSWLRIKGSP